eukprot:TRINITY_DN3191_c1_g1_i1.p1 TRINITY_DN3191_c1_g1~~TRINITY_DN3191_c1_g1_i1.p1  ORF type:complete len:692 (-),score=242.47 TRINITY_DN3191_c1_g1_i1:47-2122(-)
MRFFALACIFLGALVASALARALHPARPHVRTRRLPGSFDAGSSSDVWAAAAGRRLRVLQHAQASARAELAAAGSFVQTAADATVHSGALARNAQAFARCEKLALAEASAKKTTGHVHFGAFLENMLVVVAAKGDKTVNAWEKGKMLFHMGNWGKAIVESSDARAKTLLNDLCFEMAGSTGAKPASPPQACYLGDNKSILSKCIQSAIAKVRAQFIDGMVKEEIARIDPNGTDKLEAGSAGSDDIGSDIDMNLTGTNSFRLTQMFNREFREKFHLEESGALVDVNLYAQDYLSKPAKKSKSAKTIDDSSLIQHDDQSDANNDVFALFKIRQYTSDADWKKFTTALLAAARRSIDKESGSRKATAAPEFLKKIQARIDTAVQIINNHAKKMRAEILRLATTGEPKLVAEGNANAIRTALTDAKLSDTAAVRAAEHHNFNLWLRAANDLYENKLKANAADPGKSISDKLAKIAGAISYSNEPMLAQGSVIAVVGLTQICRDWKLPVRMAVQTFVENLGDVFKSAKPIPFNRALTLTPKSIMKGAKYLARLGDGYRLIKAVPGSLGKAGFTPACQSAAPSKTPFHLCKTVAPAVVDNSCIAQLLSDNFEILFKMKKRKPGFETEDASWGPEIAKRFAKFAPSSMGRATVQDCSDFLDKLMEDVASIAAQAWAVDYEKNPRKFMAPSKNLAALAL